MKSRKFSNELRHYSAECYRLSSDGRKWKSLASQREKLTEFLGSYANPDGTSITVGTKTIVSKMKPLTRATTFRRMDDLVAMGVVSRHGKTGEHGTAIRHIHLEPLEKAKSKIEQGIPFEHPDNRPKVSNRLEPESQIDEGKVSDGKPESQIDRPKVSNHSETQPSVLTEQTAIPTKRVGGGDLQSTDKTLEYIQKEFWKETNKTLSLSEAQRTVLLGAIQGKPESQIKKALSLIFQDKPWAGLDKVHVIAQRFVEAFPDYLMSAALFHEQKTQDDDKWAQAEEINQRENEKARKASEERMAKIREDEAARESLKAEGGFGC